MDVLAENAKREDGWRSITLKELHLWEKRKRLVKGGDKYFMSRKTKHVGFLNECDFQLGRFVLKAFKKNARSLDFE
jgi:hypothetical protein